MKILRKYFFRFFFFLLRETNLYYEMVVDNKLFPQKTSQRDLIKLLKKAKRDVSYYQQHFPSFPPSGDHFFLDFEKLNFTLEKDVLKKDITQVLNPRVFDQKKVIDYRHSFLRSFFRAFRKNSYIPLNTGGSTGNPLHFYRSRSSGLRFLLQFLSIAKYTGWQEGEGYMSCFQEGTYSQFKMIDPILAVLGVPLFLFKQVDVKTAKRFAKKLNAYHPTILMGFPSYLTELAHHLQKNGIKLRSSPKAIHCAGEMLFDHQRKMMEEIYGAPVYNIYGSNEQGLTACECHEHNGLHVLEDNAYLENDKEGHILVTILDSDYMPLIKYNTGDRGAVRYEECSCGIVGKKITKLEGRIEEYLLDSKGNKVYASYLRQLLLEVNEEYENAVLRGQFVQKKNGRLQFAVQLTSQTQGEEVLTHIVGRLNADHGIDAKGEIVKNLFQEKGKFKFLIRE